MLSSGHDQAAEQGARTVRRKKGVAVVWSMFYNEFRIHVDLMPPGRDLAVAAVVRTGWRSVCLGCGVRQ